MTIKLTGKVPFSDPSWTFRFLIDAKQATDDFIRYFPDKDPTSKAFKLAERYAEDLGVIFSLFDQERRLGYVKALGSQNFTAWKKALNGLNFQNISDIEFQYILKNYDSLDISRQFEFIDVALNIPARREFIETSYLNDEPDDIILSQILLKGDEYMRSLVQAKILEHNAAGSLQVLKYAQKEGLVTKQDNELDIFVQHFRDGNLHAESMKMLRKFKKSVKEALQPDDKIFNIDLYEHREAWLLAINLIGQKDLSLATSLAEKRLTQLLEPQQRYRWDPLGHNIAPNLVDLIKGGQAIVDSPAVHKAVCDVLDGMFYGSSERLSHSSVIKLFRHLPTSFYLALQLELSSGLKVWSTKNIDKDTKTNWDAVGTWRHIIAQRYGFNISVPGNCSQNMIVDIMHDGFLSKQELEYFNTNRQVLDTLSAIPLLNIDDNDAVEELELMF